MLIIILNALTFIHVKKNIYKAFSKVDIAKVYFIN